MKKNYQSPEMVTLALDEKDILTLSGNSGTGTLNVWVWDEDGDGGI